MVCYFIDVVIVVLIFFICLMVLILLLIVVVELLVDDWILVIWVEIFIVVSMLIFEVGLLFDCDCNYVGDEWWIVGNMVFVVEYYLDCVCFWCQFQCCFCLVFVEVFVIVVCGQVVDIFVFVIFFLVQWWLIYQQMMVFCVFFVDISWCYVYF